MCRRLKGGEVSMLVRSLRDVEKEMHLGLVMVVEGCIATMSSSISAEVHMTLWYRLQRRVQRTTL